MAKDCANIFTPKATACFRQGETGGKAVLSPGWQAVLSPGQLAEGIVRTGLLNPGWLPRRAGGRELPFQLIEGAGVFLVLARKVITVIGGFAQADLLFQAGDFLLDIHILSFSVY